MCKYPQIHPSNPAHSPDRGGSGRGFTEHLGHRTPGQREMQVQSFLSLPRDSVASLRDGSFISRPVISLDIPVTTDADAEGD